MTPLARLALFLTIVGPCLLPGPAGAHFVLNGKNRIILVDRGSDSFTLFMRIPGPLVYARELAERASPNARVDAPFVESSVVNGQVVHTLDIAVIEARPEAFGEMIASGYRITADGREVEPQVGAVTVHRVAESPPFSDPETARGSLSVPAGEATRGDPYVGEAEVDVAFLFENVEPGARIEIVSILPELQLPPGILIDNHVVDFRGGGAQAYNIPGQLHEPVVLDGSLLRAVSSFVVEGIEHILEGPDHVLFVLCLTIAATSIGMLLWQVTGFTVGHSVTLIAGFLGFAPSARWFTPTIETAIALSIVYAGLMALWHGSSRLTVLVTAAIGLLHGFGFSFVLGEILGRDSPHVLTSLLSFNVGVEIGQLMIVTAAYAALAAAAWLSTGLSQARRIGVAGVSIAVACFWVVERVQLIAQSV